MHAKIGLVDYAILLFHTHLNESDWFTNLSISFFAWPHFFSQLCGDFYDQIKGRYPWVLLNIILCIWDLLRARSMQLCIFIMRRNRFSTNDRKQDLSRTIRHYPYVPGFTIYINYACLAFLVHMKMISELLGESFCFVK